MIELALKLKDYKLLLVEDDEEIRKRLKNTLGFYFKEIYEANNGFDAYDMYLEQKPDLVITDIEMHDGDGIDLVKNIRKLNLSTPIIIISAYSKEEYLLKLINLKIDYYILKPTTREDLLSAINIALFQNNTSTLQVGKDLFLDLQRSCIFYKNEEITLRKKEKNFLELLYQNNNRITTYDLIEDYIWVDKIMTQDALKTFIKELRKKLPVNIIENIIQEGYKLAEY